MRKIEERTTNKIKFGKYYTGWGVPSIEVINPDGTKAYLSAFRRYAFQVSGTRDGEWDRGSTPVFGLETLTTVCQKGSSNLGQQETVHFITTSAAMMAVMDYCGREGFVPPTYYALHKDEEWNKFISNSLNFAAHKEVEIVDDEHM